jgi:hypothetical protein
VAQPYNGGDIATTLTALFEVPPELEEYFKVNYPQALERVKVLAERAKQAKKKVQE